MLKLKVFEQKKSESIPFAFQCLLSVPSDYNSNDEKKWALLLFLHGLGECHPPIDKLLNNGPPKLVQHYQINKQNPDLINDEQFQTEKFLSEHFVICCPQDNQGEEWNNIVLIDLIDQIISNYQIDQNKIYCTGISMGKFYFTRQKRSISTHSLFGFANRSYA
jgi:predicted peptidase